VYRDRARATALNYFNLLLGGDEYVFPFLAHYNEMKGVALLWADIGDETLRVGMGDIADAYGGEWPRRVPVIPGGPSPAAGTSPYNYNEIRIWVRGIEAVTMGYAMNAPSDGGAGGWPGGLDYLALITQTLTRFFDIQYPDGGWRSYDTRRDAGAGDELLDPPYPFQRYPWYDRPFYMGIMMNYLMLAERLLGSDPRVLTALKKCIDHLFEDTTYNTYVPGPDPNGVRYSFKYISHQTWDENSGSPGTPLINGAADLNGLILPACAYVYKKTGNTLYLDRANLLLTGLVDYGDAETYGNAGKRINEIFSFTGPMFANLVSVPPTAKKIKLRGV
jgi:hypothetical protein